MKKYASYLDSIFQKNTRRHRNRTVFRYAGMAACAAVLLLCIWTIPRLFTNPNNPGEIVIDNDPNASIIDTSIIGLPVNNFSLSEIQFDVEMDRMVYSKLSDFFSYSAPQMFAFVRVTGTELWEDKNPGYGVGGVWKQTSSLRILSVLWSRYDGIPETLSLSQNLYGGCTGEEKNNLLRECGVYLLPLGYWQEENTWYVIGDLDVQFEIDDRGRVWTHSPHEDFNRFDGEDASALAEAIAVLTSDENLPAVITSFGQIARHWGVLVEATVMSASHTKDQWGDDHYVYSLSADNILSVSSNRWYSLQPEDGDEISAISYGPKYLELGGQYLIFLDPSEGGPYIEPGRVAKINDDGTITAISPVTEYMPYTNVFEEYGGFTVAQMKEEAERAKAWHESYAK